MGFRNVASWKALWHRMEASAKIRSHTYVVILVFLATLAAFGYYANSVRNTVRNDTMLAFQQQIRVVGTATQARLGLYESILRGGAGLTATDNTMTQANWQTYFESFNIAKEYPEIDGVGFDRYVTADQLPAFLQEVQSQNPNFTIEPAGTRAIYVPNTYLAKYPATGQSSGYDGYTDPVRRAAMNMAANTGMPAMSGPVKMQPGKSPLSSLIIYLPVYTAGMPVNSPAERQAALYGFVSLAVDANKFVTSLIQQNPNTNFGLYWRDNQKPETNTAVFQTSNFSSINSQAGNIKQTIPFTLYQHNWEVTAIAGPNVVPASERDRPLNTIFWGLLASIVLAGVVWLLISSREFLLNRQKQLEVQSAKDDLLSLASHQLRTPATVVKQYVGMLLQGYGGELTQKQTGMLKHAYDSNERQLLIINQLLYVARLDAGRITLHNERTDVRELLDQVFHEQLVESRQRHQKLFFRQPKKSVIAEVDPQYFHMAIDNLVSNAVKYTPEKGSITLAVQKTDDEVQVSVQDNGIGIDEERQKMIFDKFTRLENEMAADVSGSGIGLYLTDQIVNLQGGYIEVKSTLGKGSTFTVHLPLKAKESDRDETA
jgi:two-component system, OmpR family, sensor kinase